MLLRRAAWLALVALALLNVFAQAHNAPRGDDITLLRWAADHRADILAPLLSPLPFPGHRPGAALGWWLGGQVDGSGGLGAQAVLGALWLVALGGFGLWSGLRGGPRAAMATVALLLLTDRFRDLACWRSWMTTTGELAMLGLALVALERRWTAAAGILGGMACLFKEPALPVFAAVAWLVYRRPVAAWIAICIGAAGFGKALLDSVGPGLEQGDHLGNALGYALAVCGLGWPLVTLGAASALDGDRIDPRWAAPLLVGLCLPLGYQTFNPTYLLDVACIGAGLAGGVFARAGGGRWLLVSLALAAPAVKPSWENVRWQAGRAARLDAAWDTLAAAPPRAWRLADTADDDARWLAQRLRDDAGVGEGEGTEEVVPGLLVTR